MRKLLLVAAAVAALVAAVGATRSPKADIARNLDIFASIYKQLQTAYVDTIDADASMRTAIDAMLDEIDPYTEYFPEKEQDDLMSVSTGEYGGIGSTIVERRGRVLVSEPRDGSPALRAGLRAGDRFVTINGDSVAGFTTAQVSKKLRGQAGTELTVVVERPYGASDGLADTTLAFTFQREKIDIPPVPYHGVPRPGLGYIQLNTFSEKTYEAVRDALRALLADTSVKALALDLRGNGGGLLESAVQVAGLFVPKGTEIVRTRGRGLLNEKTYKTTQQPLAPDMPLAVITDGASASASEIVAGALQDLDRAIIVGGRSFGKGLVQSTRQLPYNGVLKVTVAKYYIPSGRLIQAVDYSHRNPDGSVARIPDSLTTVWHTRAGREVRDGGGITPDIAVEYPEPTRLIYNIVRDGWDFDWATRYAARNPQVAPAELFAVTDTMFADFKAFIDPGEFKYDRACELVLDQLEKSAKTEGYLNEAVQAQLDTLRAALRHDLGHDLDINRDMISQYLAGEVLTRAQGQRGGIIEALKHDAFLDSVQARRTAPGGWSGMLKPHK